MISIGKSTLIFDLSPLFCIILAFFLLAEKLDPVSMISAIGAFCGIYFLTLNKAADEEEGEGKSLIMGIFLVFLAAWLQASIMILVRMLNIHQVHYLYRPLYIGVVFMGFSILVLVIAPHKMNFPNYDFYDMLFMYGSGLGCAL